MSGAVQWLRSPGLRGSPPGSSTTCATPVCDAATGIAKPAAYCDGAGNCTPPEATLRVSPRCDADACRTVCLAEADCATGYTCKDNACVPKAGIACTTAGDCTSGFCVDGVCCNTACTGQCQACDAPGAAGTCWPITGDPHGTRTKCSDGGAEIRKALTCDGVDGTKCAAFKRGIDTVCVSASCVEGTLKEAATCDNKGNCLAQTSQLRPPSSVTAPTSASSRARDERRLRARFDLLERRLRGDRREVQRRRRRLDPHRRFGRAAV